MADWAIYSMVKLPIRLPRSRLEPFVVAKIALDLSLQRWVLPFMHLIPISFVPMTSTFFPHCTGSASSLPAGRCAAVCECWPYEPVAHSSARR
jgi:hypothetical protein